MTNLPFDGVPYYLRRAIVLSLLHIVALQEFLLFNHEMGNTSRRYPYVQLRP